MNQPKISVIIPSLHEMDGEYLKLCVESLRESGFEGDIIVVTNGSKVKPDLSDIFGITIHLHTRDQGQCNAVNRGVEVVASDTDYIMVSNSDMYYAPGWNKNFRNHLRAANQFEDLCFSPNLIEPTDNAGSAPPFLKLDAGNDLEHFNKNEVDSLVRGATQIGPHNESGFNLPFIIKLEVWRTIGGYDEKYDPWGSNSDTDLQTKINLAGITPVRLRDVLVYHFSNKSGTFQGHQEYWQKNWDYFDAKWGFNRDVLGSDVWMNKNMLPEKSKANNYHPDWENQYLPIPVIEDEDEEDEIRIEYDV